MQIFKYSQATESTILAAIERPAGDWTAYRRKVRPIIAAVRREGDRALRRLSRRFDGVEPQSIRTPRDELCRALESLPKEIRAALDTAKTNITRFHEEAAASQNVEIRPGVTCRRETRAIPSAGLYVPGGTAPLVSTVLMLGIPARLAGVRRIAICTPPGRNGRIAEAILAACELVGIEDVFAVGGAQAIAAMAYGTETVPKAAKIAGPGNVYVSAAKAEVSVDPQGAAIDMLAGPSELMTIADASARPAFVAADLLSQAEHDPKAQIILVTTCKQLPRDVARETACQIRSLPRREIAKQALAQSVAIIVDSLADAVAIANLYAPEHLSIQTTRPERLLPELSNAGSVFLGPWSPEATGDYCSGTNHVLPTSGMARVTGGVSVRAFQKTMTVQKLSREGLRALRNATTTLARAEGLEAHARAMDIRFGTLR